MVAVFLGVSGKRFRMRWPWSTDTWVLLKQAIRLMSEDVPERQGSIFCYFEV